MYVPLTRYFQLRIFSDAKNAHTDPPSFLLHASDPISPPYHTYFHRTSARFLYRPILTPRRIHPISVVHTRGPVPVYHEYSLLHISSSSASRFSPPNSVCIPLCFAFIFVFVRMSGIRVSFCFWLVSVSFAISRERCLARLFCLSFVVLRYSWNFLGFLVHCRVSGPYHARSRAAHAEWRLGCFFMPSSLPLNASNSVPSTCMTSNETACTSCTAGHHGRDACAYCTCRSAVGCCPPVR